MKASKLFCICMFQLWCAALFAQITTRGDFDNLLGNAISSVENNPLEKVYLHFDNSSYYLGETLWYKAYVMTNDSLEMSVSKVLHVELWNQFGQKVDEQLLRIENGRACGQFELKKKNLPGYYEVRAYTRWMRNWGDRHYFSRVFPFYAAPAVVGEYKKELFNFRLHKSMKVRPQIKQKDLEVDFFPEGGNLVKGVPSIIAFRARTPQDPYPFVSLKVYTGDGTLVDTCSVIHDGMGYFRYFPLENPGYVQLLYNGKKYKFDLPDAVNQGVCLSVTSTKSDSVSVLLRRDSEIRTDTFALCLAMNGCPYEAIDVVTNDKEIYFKFPLSRIPCGVAQIVLLSSTGDALCERMFFVNRPEKYLNITVDDLTRIYLPGEKVDLNLKVSGTDNLPVSTDVSLAVHSVVDCDISRNIDNIRTNLLLSSELRGYIHSPEYYFLSDGHVRMKELDLLLLVQGWKKYEWKKLTSYNPSDVPAYIPETSLFLEGYLRSMLTRKYLPNAEVSIMIHDSIIAMGNTRTDSIGFFRFPLNDFGERADVILQARSGKGKNKKKRCYFLLDRHFAPPLRAYDPEELLPLWDKIAYSDSLEIARQELNALKKDGSIVLDEVLIKRKRHELPLLEYDRSIYAYYDVEQMIENDLDKGKKYASLDDFLSSQSVLFRKRIEKDGTPSWLYDGRNFITAINGKIVLNNLAVNQVLSEVEGVKSVFFCRGSGTDKYLVRMLMEREADDVDGTDMDQWSADAENVTTILKMNEENGQKKFGDIDLSDVLTPVDLAGGNNMMMVIETHPGIDFHLSHKAARGLRPTYIQGYSEPKAFYSPDYSGTDLPLNKDHRRTLYWNPNITTDVNGEARVHFYNAQQYTLLHINAETMTRNGKMGFLNK